MIRVTFPNHINPDKIVAALRWVGKQTEGVHYWHTGITTIVEFEHEEDAILFKLTFGV